MPTDLQTLYRLRVPVIVQIAQRKMAVDAVLNLGPGTIIELNKPSDALLDLLVNNKPIAQGLAVKVAENFGIRVNQVGTAQERIEALAE